MQNSFDVAAASGRYSVTVGSGLLADVVARYPHAIYAVDAKLVAALPESASKRIAIEALESNKSLEYAPHIIGELRALQANRDSHVVAVGGGIVQDIVTFAASIYMRGVSWTYMPTTVLGMVDSCIGGKSSINVAGYKNLVGNFYPPKDVAIDTAFVSTLDAEMITGGLFEAAKICYARGYDQFLRYLDTEPAGRLTPERAQNVILTALTTKKWFIETDEFDQNERLLLNFGHTFGHAIEAGTDFGVSHGIAVGLGMLIAVDYARAQGSLSASGQARAAHLAAHVKDMLTPQGRPLITDPPFMSLALIAQKFEHDKKHKADRYRVVLPQTEGDLVLTTLPKTSETKDAILTAYRSVFSDLGWAFSQ